MDELTDDFLLAKGWVKKDLIPIGWGWADYGFVKDNKALRYVNYVATGEYQVGYSLSIDNISCETLTRHINIAGGWTLNAVLRLVDDYYKFIDAEYVLQWHEQRTYFAPITY